MTQSYTQIDPYSRNPALIGNDINLTEGEDITVKNGDIQTITNVQSIYKSINRRLYTTKLDYQRLIKTIDGIVVTGSDFGNDAFNYLSALNNSFNRDFVSDEIRRIFETEARIKLQSIDFEDNGTGNKIQIRVVYTILSNNNLATLII